MTSIRVLLITALMTGAGAAHAATMIYDVDPAYRQEVYRLLQQMLDVEVETFPELYGRAQLLPNGQIVVDTISDERQAQVAAVLAEIAERAPEPAPTITLRYWVLHGVPGGEDASDLPATLLGVKRELEAVHGTLGIRVIDAAAVSGRGGQRATYHNDRWEIWQDVYVNGDQLNAEISLDHELQAIALEVGLMRGEFVVLGTGTSEEQELGSRGVLAVVVNWPEGG